jgi:hypothetical protein
MTNPNVAVAAAITKTQKKGVKPNRHNEEEK